MTRILAKRYMTGCVPLALVLLLLAVTSSAWADSDDGIVRVRSAVPMAEAIARIKADIASKGIKFFSRSIEIGGRCRHYASSVHPPGVWKPAARNSVHHLESECRVGLAGPLAADAG